MDLKDERDAAEALARWFKSQEISPRDSVFVMCKLIATLFAKFWPKSAHRRAAGVHRLVKLHLDYTRAETRQ